MPIVFQPVSRAEQGWKVSPSPNRRSNHNCTSAMNHNDRRVHIMQGTVQTKAIPLSKSQQSEAFVQQSDCPWSQMVGPVLHKAIYCYILAGWGPEKQVVITD